MHAYLSVFCGYSSLLGSGIDWCIDFIIVDVNGQTTVGCAYSNCDLDSVHILRIGGAPAFETDQLGRSPLDLQLQPVAFQSLIDIDSEAVVGLDAETHSSGDDSGEYIALGERFSASDPLGNKNSNHGNRILKTVILPGTRTLMAESLVHSLAAMKEGVGLETVK